MHKILIIDDDETLRKTIAYALRKNGFIAVEGRSESEGIKLVQAHGPSLILCDLNLEDVDGTELLVAVRKNAKTADIPFILMTGQADQDDFFNSNMGPDEVLAKPFTVSSLISAVNRNLKSRGLRKAPAKTGGVSQNSGSTEFLLAKPLRQISREQLEALTARLRSRLEEERSHLARAIHDDLTQDLTALSISLSLLDSSLTEPLDKRSLPQLRKNIRELSRLVDGLIHSAQKITAELRPKVLDELGLIAGLEWMVERFQKSTGIRCELRVTTTDRNVPPNLATELYRLTQEILANVAEHADASLVNIRVDHSAQYFRLEVEDNGEGIAPSQIDHDDSVGLLAMRQRTEHLGGIMKITGSAGKGTSIVIQVPLNKTRR